MCLLILARPGHRVPDAHLVNAWATNPDGAGFAYIHRGSGKIVTRKTMDLDTFVDSYDKAFDSNPDTPFLVHLRYATHGTTDLDNVHPFDLDNHTVVGHNGMINCLMRKDGRSDTRTFVEDYLRRLPHGWQDDNHLVDLIQDYTSGSKLVLLTTDPFLGEEFYILNEDKGHWDTDDGVWYSNYSYANRTTRSVDRTPKSSRTGSLSPAVQSAITADAGYSASYASWWERNARPLVTQEIDSWDDEDSSEDSCLPCGEYYCITCDKFTDTQVCFACDDCLLCDDEGVSAWNCREHPIPFYVERAYMDFMWGDTESTIATLQS